MSPEHLTTGKKMLPTDRFWLSVDKSDINGCWLWTGTKDSDGYGRVRFSPFRGERAHRVALFLSTGIWPLMSVLHTCDNSTCVREDHLYEGTTSQNREDMLSRGRSNPPRGERNQGAKLTEDQVREIRGLCALGVNHRSIAEQYGIHKNTVGLIKRGLRWGYLDPI